jgi:hypothetical protein
MELEGGMRTALRQLTSHSLTVICTFLAICRSWALYKTVVSASAAPLALGTTGEPDRTSSVFRCAIWNDSSELGAETEPELQLLPETSVCAVLLEMTAGAGAPPGAGVSLPDGSEVEVHADAGARASAVCSSSLFAILGTVSDSCGAAGRSTVLVVADAGVVDDALWSGESSSLKNVTLATR